MATYLDVSSAADPDPRKVSGPLGGKSEKEEDFVPPVFLTSASIAPLDKDGDGIISRDELRQFVRAKTDQDDVIRHQRWGLAILLVGVLAVGIGLGVELHQSRIGETKQTDATPEEFAVSDAGDGKSAVNLVDKKDHPIRTDRTYDKALLTSELPDAAFDQLEHIKITGPDGTVNFKTSGWARYTTEDSRCGSVVVVYTLAGHVQFDGAAMTFTEAVGGSFQRAGFVVSGNRKRRRSLRSGRGIEETMHTLLGVSEISGQFRFLEKLDLSALSCGDEVPQMKMLFDGNHTDLQAEEEKLILCGENMEGYSPCPANGYLTTDSRGLTYYKRATQIRAKKVDGVWRSIRSTSIPELDNNMEVAEGLRGGRMVELTVGNRGTTYQFFPASTYGRLARCSKESVAADYTTMFEANNGDEEAGETYIPHFIGYDVFNGHYVKHFKIYYGGGPKEGADYYESYDEGRPYSFGLMAPTSYTTYESVKTDDGVEPDFLQGDGYPSLDELDSNFFLNSTQCTDENEIAKLGSFGATLASVNQSVALSEALQSAAMPNLGNYLSMPFELSDFERTVHEGSKRAHRLMDYIFAENDDLQALEGNHTGDRDRRAELECDGSTSGYANLYEIPRSSGTWGWSIGALACAWPPSAKIYANADGKTVWNDFEVTGGGEVGITVKINDINPKPYGEAYINVWWKYLPQIRLTLRAEYQRGWQAMPFAPARKHIITLTGEAKMSTCDGKDRKNGWKRAARAAIATSSDSAVNRHRRIIPGSSEFSRGMTQVNNYNHYAERIPGLPTTNCPTGKGSMGVAVSADFEGPTFAIAKSNIWASNPKAIKVKIFISGLGIVGSHEISLKR